MKGQQAHMHQNLLQAEFASGEYRNAGDKTMHVSGVMKALTKVLHKSFCCTYACCQLHLLDSPEKSNSLNKQAGIFRMHCIGPECCFALIDLLLKIYPLLLQKCTTRQFCSAPPL
jgi:hypothetical protein